jgi:hypothetical protein
MLKVPPCGVRVSRPANAVFPIKTAGRLKTSAHPRIPPCAVFRYNQNGFPLSAPVFLA